MALKVGAINIYPVKSTAGLAVDDAVVEARGLRHDRRFMVVDKDGKFVTARKHPRLLLVHAVPTATGVRLTAPRQAPLDVEIGGNVPQTREMEVAIWRDTVSASRISPAADDWLSRHLSIACHLVHMGDGNVRPANPQYSEPGDEVSFADAMPLLVIGESSLDDLNTRLEAALPMARFRPNLVIAGSGPYDEDSWRRIRIGKVELALVKPCDRCVLTTIDPETAVADRTQEPLRTLATYRRWDGKVWFGQNATPRVLGRIQVGDELEVVD